MKFSHVLAVSVIIAVIAFLVAPLFTASDYSVAISVLIGAFLSPYIVMKLSSREIGSTSAASDVDVDVKTVYVGNLPYRANETSVRELFSEHGVVHSVRLMKDKHTGKRRGFGFVEMSASDCDSAIQALNDKEFQERTLKVREAKDRPDKVEETA
jgi:RNA recognition motif-containing protein